MDIAVAFKNLAGDLRVEGGDLAMDGGLMTAVVLSLFLDARARDDDEIPDGSTDRRGWWADVYGDLPDAIGSRLWLLSREKQLASVLTLAKEYAEEALAWLVTDGVARAVLVTAEITRPGVLGLLVQIERPDGSKLKHLFDNLWESVQ